MPTELDMKAMDAELQNTLSHVGYAKVLVSLKPQLAAATTDFAETSLEKHFTPPSAQEAESLALAAEDAASNTPKRRRALAKRAVRVYPRLGLAIGFVDSNGAAGLAADASVDVVVPAPQLSLIRPVDVTPAKAASGTTWGIDRLRVEELWDAGITGKGVVVGHLDTGLDGKHPVLKDAIAAFAEFDLAGDPVPGAQPWDSGRHGTHTAGTIVGRPTGNGKVGVAPEAKLASAMVIEGGQVLDRILAGMEWILEKNARILSMSLGLRGFTPAFQVIVDALRGQNVLPVIAVGNEGPLTSRSPGNYPNVLSVGACAEDETVASFSSSETFARTDDPFVPDLVAPGVAVLSCVPGGSYAEMRGSSMATPHVAGLAALLLQAKPGATVDELESAILQSCNRPASMSQDRANRGVPDAPAAIAALTGHQLAPLAAAAKPAKAAKTRKKTARRKPAPKRATRLRSKARKASRAPGRKASQQKAKKPRRTR